MLGDDNSSPNPHIDDSKDSLAPDTEQSKAPARSLRRENEPDSVKANFIYTLQKDVLEEPT